MTTMQITLVSFLLFAQIMNIGASTNWGKEIHEYCDKGILTINVDLYHLDIVVDDDA